MVRLIVGLGNPGQQYEKTRHNAGFLFLDRLVGMLGGGWNFDSSVGGMVAACDLNGRKLLFLKPCGFMNRSGISVGNIVRYYKIESEEVLVVHDELDFNIGVVRLKRGGGHAGHNGLRDIISHLNNNGFWRLRIGIGRPASGGSVASYVLSSFAKHELLVVDRVFCSIDEYVERVIRGEDFALVMNAMNSSE